MVPSGLVHWKANTMVSATLEMKPISLHERIRYQTMVLSWLGEANWIICRISSANQVEVLSSLQGWMIAIVGGRQQDYYNSVLDRYHEKPKLHFCPGVSRRLAKIMMKNKFFWPQRFGFWHCNAWILADCFHKRMMVYQKDMDAFWHTLLQRKHKHVVEGFLIASMNQTYFCPLFSHPLIGPHYFDGIWFPTHTSRNKCVARLHCDAHCQVVDAQLLPHRMHRPDQHMRHGHALLGV